MPSRSAVSAATPFTSRIDPGGGLGAATKRDHREVLPRRADPPRGEADAAERGAGLAVHDAEQAHHVLARRLLEGLVDQDLSVPLHQQQLRRGAPGGRARAARSDPRSASIRGAPRGSPRARRPGAGAASSRRGLELGDAQQGDHHGRRESRPPPRWPARAAGAGGCPAGWRRRGGPPFRAKFLRGLRADPSSRRSPPPVPAPDPDPEVGSGSERSGGIRDRFGVRGVSCRRGPPYRGPRGEPEVPSGFSSEDRQG